MINNDNELSKTFESVTGQRFEVFYRKYRPKLVWYLTRYTKDQEKAADFAEREEERKHDRAIKRHQDYAESGGEW